jgi:ectoine hydroxylase-related dioxygenase (phytanoyl-CoA dioxygenase family)
VNQNGISPVIRYNQTYLNQYLATSRTAFDLVTSDRITSICQELLGPVHRMVGKRIYETRFGQRMNFHSDMETPCSDPTDVEGLGLILYLTDTDDGCFQVIPGSQRIGRNDLGSRAGDAELEASGNIKSFPGPRGSYLIYNARLLHRAQPISEKGVRRQSMHFQVNRTEDVGEPILVNIGWLGGLSEAAKTLLGFGVPNKLTHDFPVTSLKTMPKDYLRQVAESARGFLS